MASGDIMLKIKDGKLYGSNYSFALPEGFDFNVSAIVPFGGHRLEFGAADRSVIIIIYFEKGFHSAKEDMQGIIDANNNLTLTGEFISVKRGEGVGIGVYYRDEFRSTEHYEERYDFKENRYEETQLDIDISVWKSSNGKYGLAIKEALELPAVKAFLGSIEYF